MAIAVTVKKRGCGWPQDGGVYLITGSNESKDGILPRFVIIDPPVPNPGTFHRAPVLVNGDAVLNRQPYESWLAGTSKKRLESQQGDVWALEVFGMPAHRRLITGECAGVGNVNEALAHLTGKINWSNRIPCFLQRLTILDVPQFPRCASAFSKLIRDAQDYAATKSVGNLIGMAASTWQLADLLPPRKTREIIPSLSSILTLLNLPKDAVALRQRYVKE